MVKVRVAGKKDLLEDVVRVLAEVGVLHLTDANRRTARRPSSLVPCADTSRAEARRETLRASLRQIDEAAALLQVDLEAEPEGASHSAALWDLGRDLEDVRRLSKDRNKLADEFAVAERYRKLCQAFAPVMEGLGRLRHLSSVGVTLDARYRDQVIPFLRQRLSEITDGACQLMWRPLNEASVGLLVLFPPAASPEISTLLSQENIQEIRLPKKYEALTIQDGLAAVESLLRLIPDKMQQIDRSLACYREKWGRRLPVEHRKIQLELDQTEVVRLFAATRYLFVIEGYLPELSLERLRSALSDAFGDQVHVSPLATEPEEQEEVPIAWENPSFFRPFERLLSFLPPPRYGTVDPTPLLAMSFPLFFGLILGDVGYGILILASGFAVRRRWRQHPLGRDLGFLLVAVGAVSILFGFVYGEVFGDLGHRLGLRPLWGDRLRGATAMLVLAVSIGAAHVVLGFLLGAYQAFRARLAGRAAGHIANVIALFALFALLGALAQVLPRSSWRAWAALLAAAVVFLVYLEGAVALVELISALGNILSYARLMALGMASAALAVVANQLGGTAGNVILGVIVALLLHAMNFVLGLFSPTVHSLRLHYVEFLPRFYQYGGRIYRPFRKGEGL